MKKETIGYYVKIAVIRDIPIMMQAQHGLRVFERWFDVTNTLVPFADGGKGRLESNLLKGVERVQDARSLKQPWNRPS